MFARKPIKMKAISLNLICVVIFSLLFAACKKDEDDREPTSMIIDKIVLTEFPSSDGEASWDSFSGSPDIYLIISRGSSVLHYSLTTNNANSSTNYSFDLNPSVEIFALSEEHSVRLYDEDNLVDDDYMGGISFTPESQIGDLDDEIELSVGQISMTLEVSYKF
jgi:hypothetical protein